MTKLASWGTYLSETVNSAGVLINFLLIKNNDGVFSQILEI